MDELFVVETMPERVKYRPGDEISYEGISFSLDGVEVPLDLVFFSVPEGSMWQRRDKSIDVVASYIDYETVFTLKRKHNPLLLLLPLLAVLAAIVAVLVSQCAAGPDEFVPDSGGATVYTNLSNMSQEEKQRFVDEKTAASVITVKLSDKMVLSGGRLTVNFSVVEPNNGFSERLEIRQGGRVVASSEIIPPGGSVEWLDTWFAGYGDAVAVVYGVKDGEDSGAPVSVEVEIIDEAAEAERRAAMTGSRADSSPEVSSGPVSEAVAGPVVEPVPAVESVPVVEPEPVPVVESAPEPVPEPVSAVYDLGASFVGWEVPASGIVDYQGLGWFMCHSNTWQGGVVSSLCPGDVVVIDGIAYTVAGVTRAGVGESVADWRYAYEDYKLFSTCIEDGSNDVWIVYAC